MTLFGKFFLDTNFLETLHVKMTSTDLRENSWEGRMRSLVDTC